MKKKFVFAVCFLIFAFLCGCEPNPTEPAVSEQSDAAVSLAVSDVTEEASSEESSEEPVESSEESSEEPVESSEESSEEPVENSEESSEEPVESSEGSSEEPVESSEESSEEPVESSEESFEEPDESSEESFEEPDESSEESLDESSEAPDESSTESSEEEVYDIGDAEFLPSGYLLYNGAAYNQIYYSARVSQAYADTYALYARTFSDVGIHVINPPASAYNIANPAVVALLNDQYKVLHNMRSHIRGGVNFVMVPDAFKGHIGEYLYFKSDFHWTQLGAYYAYVAFAESVGLTPTPLEAFEQRVIVDNWIGRTYEYALDERVKTFYDTIYAYMPTKTHTMDVYDKYFNLIYRLDNCIVESIKNYSCFLTGDQPFLVINVPENDQDKTVLVIKESSGNAFVPYLTEHYGNILVVDPRHISVNVNELVESYGIDDIIFFTMASTAQGETYNNYYREMIKQ